MRRCDSATTSPYSTAGSNNAGLPEGVRFIIGDVEDDAAYAQVARQDFDVVCQFRLFTPAAMARDIGLFTGHCGQYVFISSASGVHASRCAVCPITESTPLENPYWAYSRAKAEMEGLLRSQTALPYTIVRPSHTYRTQMPTPLGGAGVADAARQAGRRAWRRRVAVDHHPRSGLRSPVRATPRRAAGTGRSVSHHE